jgi:hypothetical protein
MDRERAERRWRRRTPRGNFLWMRSWQLTQDRTNAGPIESHRELIHPDRDGDYYDVGVLPDQRRPGVTDISLELKVSGHVPAHELGNHLLKVVQMLLHSGELWGMLGGAPLDGPRTFGLMRSDQAPATPPGAGEGPSPSAPQTPVRALETLRDGIPSRLTEWRQDPTFPLRDHTLEECCEVLVMLTCGQEIVLLVDRDPWRWEHTAEELRVAEETFGPELEALRALTSALSEVIGAEQAPEQLLSVFVEGGPERGHHDKDDR